ncbi:uncharacterized protein HMPREF1541_01702 [Cyphellophora europaea CBS 101466]|uniref:Stress-response A/B barrel domain-containing protein n=1 Tax=Cyphellophora europaea (strain CBS 101466) TaxID=1220924 RepID=W2S1T5_CYPE1|nr:uncharacterized protein HMPREF1541_01702 [Cyphellophora europaea CBS 101466]ETN42545.1 hypothetical protein HMPREF1541_01702 [Cyphellophora europaea CBS 101466]
MVVIHIVLFKFRRDTSEAILKTFVTELKKLKALPCVQDQKLEVGGPSITTPAARSQGFQYCLLSYHKDRAALDAYQASAEHHRVTSQYMWPFNEDLVRFDFETDDGIDAPSTAALTASAVTTS